MKIKKLDVIGNIKNNIELIKKEFKIDIIFDESEEEIIGKPKTVLGRLLYSIKMKIELYQFNTKYCSHPKLVNYLKYKLETLGLF